MGHIVTRDEVEIFLTEFKQKMTVFEQLGRYPIDFDQREKNRKTILDLELKGINECIEYLKKLSQEDYSEGPLKTINYPTDLWVFGKMIKGVEIYIKITVGAQDHPVMCISFHEPISSMNYPLKN